MDITANFSTHEPLGCTLSISKSCEPFAFSHLLGLTTNIESGTPFLPESKKNNELTEADSENAKKPSKEERAATLLMLFLFSQQIPQGSHSADMPEDEGLDTISNTAADTASVTLNNKSHSKPNTLKLEARLQDGELTDAPSAAVGQKAQKPSADDNLAVQVDADKQPVLQPLAKTQPVIEITNSQQAFLPIAQQEECPPPLETSPTPRTLAQSIYSSTPTIGHQAAPPPSELQSAALPLRSGQFSEMLSQRVMWLSSQNLQAAQIELSPKDLGTLDVRVSMMSGQAEVSLGSSQSEVRSVLEGQLPRLQEMLESQGLPAPRLGVFDSSFAQHKEQGGKQPRSSNKSQVAVDGEEQSSFQPLSRQTLIDFYA